MNTQLRAIAYAGKESKEFQKHYNAVKFCIENELSFPKETSDFFKGKLGGDDLEDIKAEAILGYLENGISVEMPFRYLRGSEVQINVSEIPSGVDLIVVKLS